MITNPQISHVKPETCLPSSATSWRSWCGNEPYPCSIWSRHVVTVLPVQPTPLPSRRSLLPQACLHSNTREFTFAPASGMSLAPASGMSALEHARIHCFFLLLEDRGRVGRLSGRDWGRLEVSCMRSRFSDMPLAEGADGDEDDNMAASRLVSFSLCALRLCVPACPSAPLLA